MQTQVVKSAQVRRRLAEWKELDCWEGSADEAPAQDFSEKLQSLFSVTKNKGSLELQLQELD